MAGIDYYTKLCLDMDGPDTSTTFLDSSLFNQSVAANGNAQVDTAQQKFGTGSLLLDGSGDYLSATDNNGFNLAGNNWTIDFWVRLASNSTYQTFVSQDAGSVSRACSFDFINDGKLQFYFYNLSDSVIAQYQTTSAPTMNTGTWYHVEYARSGNNAYIFLDGTSLALTTLTAFSGSLPDYTSSLYIGAFRGTANYLNAHVDEFRFTNGVVRHTSDFTPATEAYSLTTAGIDDDTAACIHWDGTDGSTAFYDDSPNNYTVTAYGDAQIDTAQKKFGTGSLLLDGTGDYAGLPSAAGLSGAGDFVVDCWSRFNSLPASFTIAGQWDNNQNSWLLLPVPILNSFYFYYSTNGSGSYTTLTFAWTPSVDTWYHIAIVRSGSNLYAFIDGTQIGTTKNIGTASLHSSSDIVNIGAHKSGTLEAMDGWIDEFRISKGTDRGWTSDFTPPSEAYRVDVAIRNYNRIARPPKAPAREVLQPARATRNFFRYLPDVTLRIPENYRQTLYAKYPPLDRLAPAKAIRREGIWGPATPDRNPQNFRQNLKGKYPPHKSLIPARTTRRGGWWAPATQEIIPYFLRQNLRAKYPHPAILVPARHTRKEGVRASIIFLTGEKLSRNLRAKYPPLPALIPGRAMRNQPVYDETLDDIPIAFLRTFIKAKFPPLGSLAPARVFRQPGRPPQWTLYEEDAIGLFRIEGVPVYEAFVGPDGIPDVKAAPDATSTSLPFTVALAAPPSGSTIYRVICALENEYGIQSLNLYPRKFEIDSAGDQVTPDPTSPENTELKDSPGLKVAVISEYHKHEDGANAADTWDIYLTTDGTDPDPDIDSPTQVDMHGVGTTELLREILGAYASGSTIKAIVRVSRSGDGADDGNSTIYTMTMVTTPDAPTGGSPFLGSQNLVATDGVG